MTYRTGGASFPAEIWRPFAESRAPVRCSPGHLIYLQGSRATCFYYLRAGQVKSFIQSADGGERVLRLYSPGSIFGEASFFDELPRVSSAVAVTSCQLVAIDRALVAQEFARDPALAMTMIQYLARTVRLLSNQLDEMAFRPVQWRVARHLLDQAAPGEELALGQEDLAAAVSSSRITVSRVLGEFARRGWLKTGYRRITLLDRKAMEDYCRDET